MSIAIASLPIEDAMPRYRSALVKSDRTTYQDKDQKSSNYVIDDQLEAVNALKLVLAGHEIEELPFWLRQSLRTEVDKAEKIDGHSRSNGETQYNGRIDQEEIDLAIQVLTKGKSPMEVLAEIVLPNPDAYFKPGFTMNHETFKFAQPVRITEPWVASWGKKNSQGNDALIASSYNGGIKISGTLVNDCEDFTWVLNQQLSQGNKFLIFDTAFSAKAGEWSGPSIESKRMFTLEINGKAVRPLNVFSQADGMIESYNGTLIFSLNNFESIKTLSIKTFDGREINLNVSNIRIASDSNVYPEIKPKFNLATNQLGYLKGFPKKALLTFSEKRDFNKINFNAIDSETGKVVYQGTSDNWQFFAQSGQMLLSLDFSVLNKLGLYKISIPKQQGIDSELISNPFPITDSPAKLLQNLRNDSLNAYYYWTCGEEGPYNCHDQDKHASELGAESKIRDVSGGWHDAGDFGKYVPNGAFALGVMLEAYDYFPAAFKYNSFDLKNEVSGDDLLNYGKTELDWLLKMQTADGSVNHKVASRDWPMDEEAPASDQREKTVIPPSTTATADLAAVMAKASVIYKNNPKAHAERYLEAAKAAWAFLEKHPEHITIKPTYAGKQYGGPYIDEANSDQDERFWAAVELYNATGKENYANFISKYIGNLTAEKLSQEPILYWSNVNFFGYYSLVTSKRKLPDEITSKVRQHLISYGDNMISLQEKNPFQIAHAGRAGNMDWGSNGVILTEAMQLLFTYKLTADSKYALSAYKMMDYIFGLNAVGYSFVTGYGSKFPKDVHFRPTMSGFYKRINGMVSGGANSTEIGGDVPLASIWKEPPYTHYADNHRSWATNEVAINWNAPLVAAVSILNEILPLIQSKNK
ncbi:MAG: glycoside hydrolase family 9 protein [Candidatus Saganbacteria bacterium]|nr:glycoside hydrolase family 9 protein [Candidatus Saganbacteria bacterium]